MGVYKIGPHGREEEERRGEERKRERDFGTDGDAFKNKSNVFLLPY